MKSKKAKNTKSNKGYMHENPLDPLDSSTIISTNSSDMKPKKSSIMNKKMKRTILIGSERLVNQPGSSVKNLKLQKNRNEE